SYQFLYVDLLLRCLFFFQSSRAHRDLHSFPTRRSSDLFVRFFAKQAYSSVVTAKVLEQYTPLVKRVFTQIVNDQIAERLKSAFKDRKSTRLNSSHVKISYAVFCLKKKTKAKC